VRLGAFVTKSRNRERRVADQPVAEIEWLFDDAGEHSDCQSHISWASGWGLELASPRATFWHYGNLGTSQSVAFAERRERSSLVVLTNGARGLWAARTIVAAMFNGPRPAFDWIGVRA
jgi:hypothetical protein